MFLNSIALNESAFKVTAGAGVGVGAGFFCALATEAVSRSDNVAIPAFRTSFI
jgi:F0F1-type ATP synthase membrane subunit c/vacuolar-type H+-ATPase subunit K